VKEASPAGARFGGAKANAVMREPGLLRLVCDRGCKELVSLNPCQCLGESPSRKLAGTREWTRRSRGGFLLGREGFNSKGGGGNKPAVGETGKRPKAVNCQYCRGWNRTAGYRAVGPEWARAGFSRFVGFVSSLLGGRRCSRDPRVSPGTTLVKIRGSLQSSRIGPRQRSIAADLPNSPSE
jgi:hypothetical protein